MNQPEDAPMLAVWVFRGSHTHLFPGARLRIESPSSPLHTSEGLVVFGDDTEATARINFSPTNLRLHVDAYTTRSGTSIAAASWEITEPVIATANDTATAELRVMQRSS